MDAETARSSSHRIHLPTLPRDKLGKQTDLIIVVGGDGSMLHAVYSIIQHGTPVIGINRGRFGFSHRYSPQ